MEWLNWHKAKQFVFGLPMGREDGWLSKSALGTLKKAKAASAAGLLLCLANGAFAACSDTIADLQWRSGGARFTVEVADDFDERSQGLMYRESLGRYHGMVFIYEKPGPVSFWMKNTLIPLDMIFLNQHGIVQKIHSNAVPGDLQGIPGGDDILVVLEINGGLAGKLGIPVGAHMRHPAFSDRNPAWPCD